MKTPDNAFKVGDRVIVTGGDYADVLRGHVCVVAEIRVMDTFVRVTCPSLSKEGFVVLDDELQHEHGIATTAMKCEVFRRGGGGQQVCDTSSVVRVTHLPTGLVVEVSTDRSTLRARAAAILALQQMLGVTS